MAPKFVGLAQHVREDDVNGQTLDDDQLRECEQKVGGETRLKTNSIKANSGCDAMTVRVS